MEDLHRGMGGGGAHNQNIFVFSREVDGFIAGGWGVGLKAGRLITEISWYFCKT